MYSRNTENKLFTTLFATFAFLIVASFVSKDAHTQNVQNQVQQEVQAVKTAAKYEIDPKIATVYVVGKRLPKADL